MARSIYFSFHYKDVSSFRANVVRNSWVTQDHTAKFVDKSMWEEAEKKGADALKSLIDKSMNGTSVTVILVGSETFCRRYVRYEIVKSFTENKGLLPIHINRISAKNEGVKAKGPNPLDCLKIKIDANCRTVMFFELVNSKWIPFKDLPSINNRVANSVFFEDGWFNELKCGRSYKFSEIFEPSYDWITDNGYQNFSVWIEDAADFVGR